MALRKNPVTGVMEDDGQPAAASVPLGSIFPPKPEHETTRVVEQRVESPQSQHASALAAVAHGQQLNANEQEAGVIQAEEAIKGQTAGQTETALTQQKTQLEELEKQRQTFVLEARAADAKEIKEVADKQIAAGRARADYWKGNAGGEVFAAILRGIDRAASSFRGETGPTGVDRILEEKISAHERALVGEWEASKEAHNLKALDRNKYEAELARKRIEAANQSELEIKLIGARADKSTAALGPERASAIKAGKDAAEMKAMATLEQKRAADYDLLTKLQQTDRSPTSSPGANKPLSRETQDLVSGAEQYAKMAERNAQILEQNGGQVPLKGPLATEFETNNKKMATILQRPLGKSDPDAQTARSLQGAPGYLDVMKGKLGLSDPVGNYRKALEVNLRTLTEEANKAISLEQGSAATTKPLPTGAPTESWKGVTKTISSGTYERTGPGPNDWKKVK